MKITVLAFYDRISLFQTLKPLLFYKGSHLFNFTDSLDYCLKEDKNNTLFMFRWFLKPDHVDLNIMKKLREKYDRVFFFNGNAGGGIPRLELLDYVDYFFSKALFRDRSLYARDFYGDELYTQYYHERNPEIKYSDNKERTVCTDDEKLKKLCLFWNIGVGDFPKKKLRQRSAVWLARKTKAPIVKLFHLNNELPKTLDLSGKENFISARLGSFNDPFLNIHRNIYENKIKNHPLFRTGFVSQNQYNRETERAAMVLSPFGWGELCFRDFEAVTKGALLLKPDVSHLETWPDIFQSGETYVPLDWDGEDLLEKVEYYSRNRKERERITINAYESYRSQINNTQEKLEEILALI